MNRMNKEKEYQDWMLPAVWKHLNDGWSLSYFPGRHNVTAEAWRRLLREDERLQAPKQHYLTKIKPKARGKSIAYMVS